MTDFEREFMKAQADSFSANDDSASAFFRANQAAIEFYNSLPEKTWLLKQNEGEKTKTLKARSSAEAEAMRAKNPALKYWHVVGETFPAEVHSQDEKQAAQASA